VSFETSALIMLLAALGRLLWRGPRFAPMPKRLSYIGVGISGSGPLLWIETFVTFVWYGALSGRWS
jgi:hypothetical protein